MGWIAAWIHNFNTKLIWVMSSARVQIYSLENVRDYHAVDITSRTISAVLLESFYRGLGGPRGRSRRCEEERNVLLLPGIEPRSLGRAIHSDYTFT
jgi:hypothetical protein